MKRVSYFLFTFVIYFVFSLSVNAEYGDLVYDVTDVNVFNDKLTIQGYAFIHKTNNYATVYKRDANGLIMDNNGNPIVVAKNGGQRVKIRASSGNLYKESEYVAVDPYDSSVDIPDYNFFYWHYWAGPEYGSFDDKTNGGYYYYNNSNGALKDCDDYHGICYYEDIYFKVTFTYEQLRQLGNNDISFDISVCNNDYGCSGYESLKIPLNEIVIKDNDYFELVSSPSNGKVKFVAIDATINPAVRSSSYVRNIGDTGGYYNIVDTDYIGRIETSANKGWLQGVRGSYSYPICVSPNSKENGKAKNACIDVDENGFCKSCTNGKIYYAFGSYLDFEGFSYLKFRLKSQKKCQSVIPSGGSLKCNNNKNYNSTCDELDILTEYGNATVKIEETGNVSSVLTPNSVYAGGGFNFGIMYYNTIKWSYVPGQNISDNLHKKVTDVMNDKIKDYDSYVAGINISNLKLGGKTFNMVKKCTTSNIDKDYYNKELTVSCIFTFPKSEIDQLGNVNYNYDVSGISVNNKYYTPIDYSGNYKIEANIVGMDRITESSSKGDSIDGKSWTGEWSDTFYDCNIDLYSLLINPGVDGSSYIEYMYNFIYRPIDLYNPFPSRNAGINWFDWYSLNKNKDRLKDTYSNLQYTVMLNNNVIADIKSYNDSHNYLEWDSINENTGLSSFISEKNYIDRVGDY